MSNPNQKDKITIVGSGLFEEYRKDSRLRIRAAKHAGLKNYFAKKENTSWKIRCTSIPAKEKANRYSLQGYS